MEKIKGFFNDKQFYKSLLFLSLPIVIQNLIASSLNMLDTMMIGRVGEVELASVGIANQYYFFFSLLIMGISSGASVFISQLWGKNDEENIRKTLGIGIVSGVIVSVIFTAIAFLVPEKFMAIFNTDPEVIKIGTEYLVIAAISYIFTSITFNYAAALRSIENTKLPMIASLIGLICNGFLNWVLIFGNLGFDSLGVKGAAIATLIARILECSVILFKVYKEKGVLAASIKEMVRVPYDMVRNVYITIFPVLLNEACWGLGNVTYSIIYGRIGVHATAAVQICSNILNLFMIVTFSLANASVVVIGKEIGANNENRGKLYAKRLCMIALVVGTFLACILFSSSKAILSVFKVSPIVYENALKILYIYALILPVKIYNAILIVGILRGGGDAKFGAIVQGITLWIIGIPLSFIAAFVFRLDVYVVVAMTAIEELIKLGILVKRFNSGNWINNVVNNLHDDQLQEII